MEKTNLTQIKSMLKRGSSASIMLVPSKMSPTNSWGMGYKVQLWGLNEDDFIKLVNSFSYYNCTKETGLRVSYYIV